MNRFFAFVSRHRRGVAALATLFVVGACFRWEVREVDDARTGQPVTRYRGLVAPWQPCGASGGGRQVNFRVHHWLCYGLVQVEATGQTM